MKNKKRDFEAYKKLGEFKTFGQYLLEGRDEKGLSRLSLVEKLIDKGQSVTEKDVKKWEKDISYPDISVIYALSEILEIHPNDLLEAKQFMYAAGLNSIDMRLMVKIFGGVDIFIWKVHCFFNIFKWAILMTILKIAWKISVPIMFTIIFYIIFILLSLLAAKNNFDDV